jgi:hypothetical protein
MMTLNLFWLAVWGLKIMAARMILLPILLGSHSQLVNAFPMPLDNEVDSADSLWLARIQPRMLLRASLQFIVWGTGAAIYIADTLGWYQLVLSIWGGIVGLSRYGVASTRPRNFFGNVCFGEFKRRAYAKLLPSLAANEEEMAIIQAGLKPKSQSLSRTSTCEPHIPASHAQQPPRSELLGRGFDRITHLLPAKRIPVGLPRASPTRSMFTHTGSCFKAA